MRHAIAAGCAGLLLCLAAAAQTPGESSVRGALLYNNHCVECHTQQMHWRSLRQARDWDSLKAQVRRWQGTAGLGWSEQDIQDVARHLNETIYRFPQPVAALR